jgi:lauroyl/myristoyl acyltransferase
MKDSYSQLENFGGILFFISIKTYLYKILKNLPLSILFKVSYIPAKMALLFYPKAKNEIKQVIQNSNPSFNKKQIKKITQDYYIHLFFHLNLVIIIPYMKKERVLNLFEFNDLTNFIAENKSSKTLLIGMHYYSFMVVYLLSNICYEQNVKLICSFALGENNKFRKYFDNVIEKTHYKFHNPINVAKGEGFHTIKDKIKENKLVFLFSDVRFKKSKRDIKIKINNQDFNFNNGASFFYKMYSEYKLTEFNLKFKNNKFNVEIKPIDSISNYYSQTLPNNLKENQEQWQLWFHSPIFNDKR